ncbi:9156_t:CDS:2, partial [Paraglomus brasilianum]
GEAWTPHHFLFLLLPMPNLSRQEHQVSGRGIEEPNVMVFFVKCRNYWHSLSVSYLSIGCEHELDHKGRCHLLVGWFGVWSHGQLVAFSGKN